MRKMMMALASCGVAVVLGLVLMALGTQAVLEDVVQASGNIGDGAVLSIDVEMSSDEEPVGVFAIQILDTTEDSSISARVLDPFGGTIATVTDITQDSVEGRFNVDVDGAYTLVVENNQNVQVLAFGAIGPVPDVSSKALAFIPFYLLLAGIMGMAGLGVYWVASVRRMRKN